MSRAASPQTEAEHRRPDPDGGAGRGTPTVFAIMPFRQPFNERYADVIKPAAVDAGFEITRSDEVYSPSAFVQVIWQELLAADVVIAEMTGSNPNVLYELGLAHAIGKPVIMLTERIDDVPADLRHMNCIVYDTSRTMWAETTRSAIHRMLLFRPERNPNPLLDPPATVASTLLLRRLEGRVEELEGLLAETDGRRAGLESELEAVAAARARLEQGLAAALAAKSGAAPVVTREEGGVTAATLALPDGKTTMELVRVPKGPFVLGAPGQAEQLELPTYWISRYSVTNAQYCAFLEVFGNQREGGTEWIDLEGESPADRCRIRFEDGRFRVEEGYERFPATYVNFYGAAAFCAWVGGELPSVEEWEKAARGTDGRHFPWGNNPPRPDLANIGEDGWARDVAPISVHLKPAGASPYGVVQAVGNVWHWTRTHFPDRDVQAVRGGSFFDYRLGKRSVYRFLVHPDGPDFSQGFLVTKRFLESRAIKGGSR